MTTLGATSGGRQGRPVSEFLLIPFGFVDVRNALSGGPFTFTVLHASQAVTAFHRSGRRLKIDYEHQSIAKFNTRADGRAPAAGWVGDLDIRSDGLWCANVTWAPRARQLIAGGECSYFSPVIYWADPDHGAIEALGPVALTNDPAMQNTGLLLAAKRETTAMRHMTVLAARPFVGQDDWTEVEGRRSTGDAVFDALSDFASAIDAGQLRELARSNPIELVAAIDAAFTPKDETSAGSIICRITGELSFGKPIEEVAGDLLRESATTSLRQCAHVASSGNGDAASWKREWAGSPRTRAEFSGNYGAFAAYKRASAGQLTTLASSADYAPPAAPPDGPAAWEAEWDRNSINENGVPIQTEFGDLATYLAFRKNAGHARVYGERSAAGAAALRGGAATSDSATIMARARCDHWQSSSLQSEFPDVEDYASFCRARAAGAVRILKPSAGVVRG